MFDRFTDRARRVMDLAGEEAHRLNRKHIDTEHILLGLMEERDGVGATTLKHMRVDLRRVRGEIESLAQRGEEASDHGELRPTPRAKRVVEYAIETARGMGYERVGTEHLLLGLLREPDGLAATVLIKLGLNFLDVRSGVQATLNIEARPDAQDTRSAGAARTTQPSKPSNENNLPSSKAVSDSSADDKAMRTVADLLRELVDRKDQAARWGEYEQAAAYRELAVQVARVRDQLGSILARWRLPEGDG